MSIIGKFFAPVLACVLSCSAALSAVDPKKVYVVANSSLSESVDLARQYCSMRGIPPENMLALPMPKKGIISRQEYYSKIEDPVLEQLGKLGVLESQKIGHENGGTRTFVSHDVDFIVLCRGVPWGILPSDESNLPSKKAGIKSDSASVDSELSAVFLPRKSLSGPVKNPMYKKSNQEIFKLFGILRVARLDGVRNSDVLSAVEGGICAENSGLRGRAYIDKSKKHPIGDKWLDSCAKILDTLGFDTDIDEESPLFGFGHRMDNPAFYFGWYSGSAKGYFSLGSFKLAKGAVAMHIYSFSAYNLRSSSSWTPALTSRGAALGTGNVFEPFLGLTHRFDLLMGGLASGMCAGEAAYFSLPNLSWQGIFAGDPLYSPFKKGLKEQLEDIEEGSVDELSQYSVARMMNLIAKSKGKEEAAKYGMSQIDKLPSRAALYWKLSEMSGKREKFALLAAENLDLNDPKWWGLAMEIAEYLTETSKSSDKALEIYKGLSRFEKAPMEFKKVLLNSAKKLASKRGEELSPEFLKIEREVAAEREKAEAAKKAAEQKAPDSQKSAK